MIAPISATGLARYDQCALSEWFRARHRRQSAATRQATPAIRLGQAAHQTVEQLIKNSAYPGEWQHQFDARWSDALDRQSQAAKEAGERIGPPDSWPDLMTIKLGTRRCLEILEPTLSADSEIRSEWEHTTSDGVIYVAADIVLQDPAGDRIVDLKTGRYEVDAQEPPRQLLLYAASWHEATARMPRTVELLLARSGQLVTLEVDEVVVQQTREAAVDAHEVLKSVQEPTPTPGEHCRRCPALGSCEVGRNQALEYDDVLLGLVVGTRRNNDNTVTALSVTASGDANPTEVAGLELNFAVEDRNVIVVGVRSTVDGRLVARQTTNVAVIHP